MRFHDIKVGHKLRVCILGALGLAFMLSVGLNRYFASVEAELSRTLQTTNDNIELALRWQGLTELNVERAVLSSITVDIALAEMIGPRLKAGIADIAAVQKQVESAVQGTPQQAPVEEVARRRARVLALLAKVRTLKGEGDGEAAAQVVHQDFLPAVKVYNEALAEVVQSLRRQREHAIGDADAVRTRAIWVGLALAGVLVVIGVVLVEALVRSIHEPLDRSVRLAQAIASGNLMHTTQPDRRDEFGVLLHALDDMTMRLRSVVQEVRTGVASTTSASVEIANGNLDLSGRTEQTAASLEEAAASMEQLTGAVTQTADVAQQANRLAANAVQAATQGGEIVSEAVTSMQHITDSSRRIGDIIGVIDGIAFQTNILALNAAVEAARAGEQGRGFAVVASEVRNLAQQSATAAREIKTLIHASVDKVEAGALQVERAGQSMAEIVGSVRRVTDLIAEITVAASEQRDGIGLVSQAVAQLDQMTQQNAALVEQSAAAAASLRDQAHRLAEVVSVFQVEQPLLLS